MVPDLDAACERFDSLGVDFIKRPSEGRMRDVAFIRDPGGYVIEVFPDRRLRVKSKI
jgi:lactoylglutathione lyase